MKAVVSTILRGAYPTIFTALAVAVFWAPLGAKAVDASPAPTETKAAAASTAPSAAAASATGDKWRFVWHNNQWWYYQPNGSWLIHDGSAWHAPQAVAPSAQVYQAPAPRYQQGYQSSRNRQFMSSQRQGGGMDNDGFWGNSARYWTYQHVLRGQ